MELKGGLKHTTLLDLTASPFQCSPNPISCLWSRLLYWCLFEIAI